MDLPVEVAQFVNKLVPTDVGVDRMGNALKLVDRLEFSRLNFGTGRPGA